ncbi:MAG: DUF3320 domain-containing protein, partial [Ilumatobacteraceae bacterium]
RRVGELAQMGTAELAALVIDIVTAEGPLVRRRLYRLVGAATGVERMSPLMRDRVDAAVGSAVRKKVLVDGAPVRKGGPDERETSLADGPGVVLRRRGDRAFDEIPLTELAEAARLAVASGAMGDAAVVRVVASGYDVGRVTAKTEATILRAITIL